jgi:hypothetical protein
LSDQLPILQDVILRSRQIFAERSAAVKHAVRALQVELGNGTEAPGGPYGNVWSGVSAALDTSHSVSDILGKIAEQVKNNVAALNQVRASKAGA